MEARILFFYRQVLKTKDPQLVDLVNKIMQYSPHKRFTAE